MKEFRKDAKIIMRNGDKVLAIPYIFYDRHSRKWREDIKYEKILHDSKCQTTQK